MPKPTPPLSPLDKLRDSIEAQRTQVKQRLRDHLSEIDPYEFEHLIRDLLEHMSFTGCEVTQQYKDGGIDLKANFSIGISEVKTLGQVKRQKATVGTQLLQQFYGAMTAMKARDEVHLGLFVTTSSFASSAVRWVDESSLPIVLVDGDKLVDLLVENGILVREVPMPAALELAVDAKGDEPGDAPPEADTSEVNEGDERETLERKRQFRWELELGAGNAFVLRARFIADPSRSFEVTGVRIAPDGDFKPARTQLHSAIVARIEPLFPGLSKDLLTARAWSGTHRVYPADQYGKH